MLYTTPQNDVFTFLGPNFVLLNLEVHQERLRETVTSSSTQKI